MILELFFYQLAMVQSAKEMKLLSQSVEFGVSSLLYVDSSRVIYVI